MPTKGNPACPVCHRRVEQTGYHYQLVRPTGDSLYIHRACGEEYERKREQTKKNRQEHLARNRQNQGNPSPE